MTVTSAILLAATPPSVHAQETTAVVTGTVMDSTSGQGVSGVLVYLAPPKAVGSTDEGGRFRFTVARSTSRLLFRRIGYAPRTIPVSLTDNRTILDLGVVRMQVLPVLVDSIAITADRDQSNPWLSEFLNRKRGGTGQYLTRQDVARFGATRLDEALRHVPFVDVRCGARAGCLATNPRGGVLRPCLDGMPMADSDVSHIPAEWAAGVEIYRSRTWAPLLYPGCDILIWTGGPSTESADSVAAKGTG